MREVKELLTSAGHDAVDSLHRGIGIAGYCLLKRLDAGFSFCLGFLLTAAMMGNSASQILSTKYDNQDAGGGPVTLRGIVAPLNFDEGSLVTSPVER